MPREDPAVAAGDLAGVQRDCGDGALVGDDLDPATDERRIQAVVVGVQAQVRVGRDAHRPPLGGVGHPVGQQRHHCKLVGKAINRPRAQRLVHPRVDPSEPSIELVLEVQLAGEAPARLEVRLRVALQPLDHALGLRISQNSQSTLSWPQKAANASVGRPPWP